MTAHKAVVVTGCNDSYFPYLRDLVHSFVACGASQKYDLAVIDGGLTHEQMAWLKRFGVSSIVNPDWPISGMEGQPQWYKVCIGRPFFPNFFSEWDVIVYVDSDCWLQNGDAIDAAVEGAWQDGFAACPMTDRCLWPLRAQTNTVFSMHWHKNCLEQYFGSDVAQQFQLYPILSGSLFAGRRDAPHWGIWQKLLVEGLRRKLHYDVDQASMTLAVHQSRLPTHFLPLHYHWIGHLGPIGLDTRTASYVEPYLPHHPISSLSLAANSKTDPVMVRTTDGRILSRLLRYGQKHTRHMINVTLGGSPQSVDGIATTRFRQSVFDAISIQSSVRFLQIGALSGGGHDALLATASRCGWRGTVVAPRAVDIQSLQTTFQELPTLNLIQAGISETSRRRPVLANRSTAQDTPSATQEIERQHLEEAVEVTETEHLSFADFEAAHDIDGFDVLLIDAKGGDWKALGQIDLLRHAPKCVQFEVPHMPPEEIALAISMLRSSGYVCYAMEDAKDLLAIRQDFGLEHFHML